MEAPEVPTEHLHEHIHEHAHGDGHGQGHGHGPGGKAKWVMGVALTAAFLAGLAAVAALLAGHHVNEAMIDQIRASDQWSFYQAKGVKSAVLASKLELLEDFQKPVSPKDRDKLAQYKSEQEEIQKKAKEFEESSHLHLEQHVVFARAVTMFQIAIAVAAISVLTQKRAFWFVSIIVGLAGVVFMIQAFGLK
jgi:hypothetical protein